MEDFTFSKDLIMAGAADLMRLNTYPYFDAARYAIICMRIREDLNTGASLFSRKHPLACWFSSILLCFSGNILACFLLGESVLLPFKRPNDIALATVVWYLVFYSPFDLCATLAKFYPIQCVLSVMKEVQRARQIHMTVAYAAELMPESWFSIVLIGAAQGAGSSIMRTFEQFIRGVWLPQGNEILRPTFATKSSILAAIVFTLEYKPGFIQLPHELVFLTVLVFLVYFKLSSILLEIHDPLIPLENVFCALFLGGIWDAIGRAMIQSKERRLEQERIAAAAVTASSSDNDNQN